MKVMSFLPYFDPSLSSHLPEISEKVAFWAVVEGRFDCIEFKIIDIRGKKCRLGSETSWWTRGHIHKAS